MAPKGKAKAKAKGKAKGADDEESLPVPAPPPMPVCQPLPEALVERHAMDKCIILAWPDALNQYKIQLRPATVVEESEEAPVCEWTDATDKARVHICNRQHYQTWLIMCEHARIQFRLAYEKGVEPQTNMGLTYTTNWVSPPSDPVLAFVDPPNNLKAELGYDKAHAQPSVCLTWTASSMDVLRERRDTPTPIDDVGPYETVTDDEPVKIQVRWKGVRFLTGSEACPRDIKEGRYYTSAALDKLASQTAFSTEIDAWRMNYLELIQGVVACFQIRIGTRYRWSAWCEESNEVVIELPEPVPSDMPESNTAEDREDAWCSESVQLSNITDREADVVWPPFIAKASQSVIEYRVTLCHLDDAEQPPLWEEEGIIAAMLSSDQQGGFISTRVRGLYPNTWYIVRVDARYPDVGKRTFSANKVLSSPFRAPFLPRPPLQLLPTAADEEEEAKGEMVPTSTAEVIDGEGNSYELISTSHGPWVAFRGESDCLTKYKIEYKAATACHGEQGTEYYDGWRDPLAVKVVTQAVQASGHSVLRHNILRSLGADTPASTDTVVTSSLIFVRFEAEVPEVVVCRLVHRDPLAVISQLHWSLMTPPVIPYFAPPSFRNPAVWPRVTDKGVRLTIRLFLHPGDTLPEEHLAHVAQAPLMAASANAQNLTPVSASQITGRTEAGHRFVSRYQLRFRSSKKDVEDVWAISEPASLPAPLPVATCKDTSAFPVESSGIPELDSMAICLGLRGVRYEIDADPGAEGCQALFHGNSGFEVEVRVGNDYRWSQWASPSDVSGDSVSETFSFEMPVPLPLPDAQIECTVQSATRLRIAWPPFERLAGITQLEYLIQAVPNFVGEGHDAGPEGAGTIEKVVLATHTPRQSDDQLCCGKEILRIIEALSGQGQTQVDRALAALETAREREREEDLRPGGRVETELIGLLPCTRYEVSVTARYPSAAAMTANAFPNDASRDGLCASVDMPGGEAAPAAPQLHLGEANSAIPPEARGAWLCVEDRPGYVLEYRAAGESYARFNPQKPSTLNAFGGSWQNNAIWHRVSSSEVSQKVKSGDDSSTILWAALPCFVGGAVTAGKNLPINLRATEDANAGIDKNEVVTSGFMPDAVEFRLCAADRSTAHPCRWAGGISLPISICLAPPRRAPRTKRVLCDERWCLNLMIEIFKREPAPLPPLPLGLCDDGKREDDGEEEEDDKDDREFLDMKRSHTMPVPPREFWSQTPARDVPVGYGHRMSTVVQVRYSLQSAITPVLRKQLEERTLSRGWQCTAPIPFEKADIEGSQCTLSIDSGFGLRDGGIYMFQARVGDGCRWSTWSHTSNAFAFRVPPPMPPSAAALGNQQPVMVDIVSSTIARVRWGEFRPATGLERIEYEVRATPQQSSQSNLSGSVVTAVFEQRYSGGFIDREIQNLLPFTPYVFTVRARYPHVGNRAWTGQQSSQPVALEHPSASQDPPTPFAVSENEDIEACGDDDLEGGDAVAPICSALLEFPEEEDGTNYELEFAHVLGDDQFSADFRIQKRIWLNPDVVEPDQPTIRDVHACSSDMNRWRVRLPDIRPFRSEPLKLAILQRVRFRLRARFSTDTLTTRWWSSLSEPVCTGFAAPDGVTAVLVAAGDRLATEIQFSLDRRLADALISADQRELSKHRDALVEMLRPSNDKPFKPSSPPGSGGAAASWPRGFGHPFVKRYQIRVRFKVHTAGDATVDGAVAEWDSWEVRPDSALPKEAVRSVMGGGAITGGRANPQARYYSVGLPMPPRKRTLQVGDVLQVGVRVGDGVKWSSWRHTREVAVAVAPPRAASERDNDFARAEWSAGVCTVSWPAAAAPVGLESIEYHVSINPEDPSVPKRIGAIVVGRSSSNRDEMQTQDSPKEEDSPKSLLAPENKTKWKVTAGSMRLLNPSSSRASTLGPKTSGGRNSILSDAASRTRTLSPRRPSNLSAATSFLMTAEFRDLRIDLRYGFTILARYPTVGSRALTSIFEIPPVSWRPDRDVFFGSLRGGIPSIRPTSAMTCSSRHGPPDVEQVRIPTDGKLSRWHNLPYVLLTWSGLEHGIGSYEIQATEEVPKKHTAGTAPDDLDSSHYEWWPCANTQMMRVSGMTCLAVRELPFLVGRFRIFDTAKQRAGQMSKPMVSIYEVVNPAPRAEMHALGQMPPRQLGVRLSVSLTAPGGTLRRATRCQVRFRALVGEHLAASGQAAGEAHDEWQELESTTIDNLRQGEHVSLLVREEDGLELGPVYEFAVRVGDACRLGQWSSSSQPLHFAVPPPVPHENGGIKTLVEPDLVTLSWDPFEPDSSLASAMPGFGQLPIEYTLRVHSSEPRMLITTFVTRELEISMRSLSPETSYFATLSARWTRFGCDETHSQRGRGQDLLVAFKTAPSSKQRVVDLSMWITRDVPGASPHATNVRLPLDTVNDVQKMTLHLDPYYASPWSSKMHDLSNASSPRHDRLAAGSETEGTSSSTPRLPVLRPPPQPPKFEIRSDRGRPLTSR